MYHAESTYTLLLIYQSISNTPEKSSIPNLACFNRARRRLENYWEWIGIVIGKMHNYSLKVVNRGMFCLLPNLDMISSMRSWKIGFDLFTSSVSLLFWAWASCLFKAYSAHTRCESVNSASQGWMYRYKLGMSCSSSWLMPALQHIIFSSKYRFYISLYQACLVYR